VVVVSPLLLSLELGGQTPPQSQVHTIIPALNRRDFQISVRTVVANALKGNNFTEISPLDRAINITGFDTCGVGMDSVAPTSQQKKMYHCTKSFDTKDAAVEFYNEVTGHLDDAIGKGKFLPVAGEGKWKNVKLPNNIVQAGAAALSGKSKAECYGPNKKRLIIQVYEGQELRLLKSTPARFTVSLLIHDKSAELNECD